MGWGIFKKYGKFHIFFIFILFFNIILSDILINENRIFGIRKIYPMPNFEINPVFISIPEVASSFHIIPYILFEVDYEACVSLYIEFTI